MHNLPYTLIQLAKNYFAGEKKPNLHLENWTDPMESLTSTVFATHKRQKE